MKARRLIVVIFFVLLIFSCDLFDPPTTGTLILKGVKTFPASALSKKQAVSVPEGTYLMHSKDMKFIVKEIYVSTSLVDTGATDNFEWILIGESDTLRSTYEIEMIANDLEEGIYQSLKILFRNEVLRYAVYVSDTNTVVEMPGSLNGASTADTTEIVNYFSSRGSFRYVGGLFQLMATGENFQAFPIHAGRTTTLYWMGGDTTCHWTDITFIWDDVDNDGAWTAGVDNVSNFEGPPNVPMWSFLVVEE